MDAAFSLATVESMALAMIRITVFLIFAPPFSHRGVNGRIKAFLGLALGIAAVPNMPALPVNDTGFFLTEAVLQAATGAALGFILQMVFAAVGAAGRLIDTFGGFELAQGFDPLSMSQSAQFGRLYVMAGVVFLFVTDGYQLVIMGIMKSFQFIPVGTSLDWGGLAETLSTQLTALIVAALQIAGPMIAVLFLTDVGLGLLTRVAPALNAFALGFPLKIYVTVAFIGTLLIALPRIVIATITTAVELMVGVR